MKRTYCFACAIGLLAVQINGAPANFVQYTDPDYSATKGAPVPKQPDAAADHVLVKFSPGRTGSAVQWLQDTGGLAVHATEALSDQGWHLLRFHPGQPVERLVRICRESPEVAFAEPDYYFYPGEWPIIPDDPKFADQWHLQNTGQYSPWVSGADIHAPKAWYYNRWAYNYTVAVIDSGVDYNHPDLAGNMWLSPGEIPGNGIDDDGNGKVDDVRGWNFFANNANPMDVKGHGTHVAGLIGATANNALGIAGVCWGARLMPLRVGDDNGVMLESHVLQAFAYARQNGAKIVNFSYATTQYSQALKDEITAANSAGVLVVAAAGNEGIDIDSIPRYPASYDDPNIISVAASSPSDQNSFNYGAASVDLAAPGLALVSASPGGGYTEKSGTSQAAPLVSGACALVWATAEPGKTHLDIKNAVLSSVDVLGSLSGKCVTAGRLNLYRALKSVYDDPYEPNDTLQTAYVLPDGMRYWLGNFHGPGFQRDDDWYRILVPAGQTRVVIFCSFVHAEGDIDILLYDGSGAIVGSSRGYGNVEKIDTVVSAGGYYYIRVFYGNGLNEYDLWWGTVAPGIGLPDLAVTGITCYPEYPLPGSTVALSVTVTNRGDGYAGPFQVGIWYDQTTAPVFAAFPDASLQVAGLAAATATTVVFNTTAPQSGSRTTWAFADCSYGESQVTEADELNNTGPGTTGFTWSVGLPYIYGAYIQNLAGVDADENGYYETASFDVAVDADVSPGAVTDVRGMLFYWNQLSGYSWEIPAWQIIGRNYEYGRKHFEWPADFYYSPPGQYPLSFRVEIYWPAAGGPLVDTKTNVVGTPLLCEFVVPVACRVYLPTNTVAAREAVTTPLTLIQNSGTGGQFDFAVRFDGALIDVRAVRLGSMAAAGNLSWRVDDITAPPFTRELRMTITSNPAIVGSGTLASIEWRGTTAAGSCDSTQLFWQTALRNHEPVQQMDHGLIRISPGRIAIQPIPGGALLTWTGSALLQSGPSPGGPWSDVPEASSPATISASGQKAFFRLRCP